MRYTYAMGADYQSIEKDKLLMAFLGTAQWAGQKAQITGDTKFSKLKESADRLFRSIDGAAEDASLSRQVVRSQTLQVDMDQLIAAFNDVLAAQSDDPDRINASLRTSIRRIGKFRDDISDAGSGCGTVVNIGVLNRPYADL